MTQRTKASTVIFAWTAFLALVLTVAVAYRADAGVWFQSYGREDADATCEEGWYPSWAYWPNDGAGGWVCNREVDDPSVPVAASGGGSTPTPTPSLPTEWVSIAGGTISLAVGASADMGVAPPCDYGTMEIRVTAPLLVTLSGPVPQAVTVFNPSFIGAMPFSGSFSVDTRCV